MDKTDKFLRTIQHHLEDCATYLGTLYAKHRINPVDRGIDPDKVKAAATELAAYREANPLDMGGILDELDQIMEGYDWVGTGNSKSGELARQEWLDLRKRLRRGVVALGGGKLELDNVDQVRVAIEHDGSTRLNEQFGYNDTVDPPSKTFEGNHVHNARPFIDALVKNPRVTKVWVGLYQKVKG